MEAKEHSGKLREDVSHDSGKSQPIRVQLMRAKEKAGMEEPIRRLDFVFQGGKGRRDCESSQQEKKMEDAR